MEDTDDLRNRDKRQERALTEEDLRKFLEAGTYEEQVILLHLHSEKNQKVKEKKGKGRAEREKAGRKSKDGTESK